MLMIVGRWAMSLVLIALVLWWAFSYGMATFDGTPYWLGVLSPIALWAAWKLRHYDD